MVIRPATAQDRAAIIGLIAPVIAAGETYALDRTMGADALAQYWFGADRQVWLAERAGVALGSYYLRANQGGGGAHVANAGFVVGEFARGQGVAREMGRHALAQARSMGFAAMQFNFVVSCNHAAVHLWQDLGFAVVGRLPRAFCHPSEGLVDALVMFRAL